ncbi:hypothetical protein SCARR_00571 [Pontiella sulfatireligans]|uniref:Uncharacterized protein n=1 Tax=Pontiella sulfatireligans TaxID=2750658 RepID=A0A6C2UEH9_9BACT|nr:hypothetical protein SCARR_00571 [Pontiella sulfatireligans]
MRVFPAVPSKWQNVEYRDLRCEGAHLVSAKRVDGKTQSFELTAVKAGDILIKTDIVGAVGKKMEVVAKDGVFTTYRVNMRKRGDAPDEGRLTWAWGG